MPALAAARGWPWQAVLMPSADGVLCQTDAIVATADSGILDRVTQWFDLAAGVVQQIAPQAWCIDLDVLPPMVT